MAVTRVPLTATTRIVAVIGDPIAHSRSPLMHNAAFRALDLDFAYGAFRVRPGDVGAAVAAVRALGLAGLNVTIPHKQAVIPHLDRLSPVARLTGAVNTIVNRDGVLHGDNTDVPGLSRALDEAGLAPRAKTAIVLGAGGSARAAVVALAKRSRSPVGRVRSVASARPTPSQWARCARNARRRSPTAKPEAVSPGRPMRARSDPVWLSTSGSASAAANWSKSPIPKEKSARTRRSTSATSAVRGTPSCTTSRG